MIYAEKNYTDLIKTTAKLAKAFSKVPTLIFCEDKISLSLEMEITSLCGGGLFCEVTTLNRFMHRLAPTNKVCSKQTISLIIKKLLCSCNDELITFKNLNSYSLAGGIAELIAQLKSAKVTPLALKLSAENFSGLFKYKILDIALIYQKYENYLEQNNLLDTNNKFSLFMDLLSEFNVEEYNVVVAGFQSVTAQTASFFQALSKRARRLDFVLLYGQDGLYVNETYNFALGLNQSVAEQTLASHPRYSLLDNLYNPLKKTGLYVDNINIFSYPTLEDEIIDIAKQIKQKVILGAQWEDFMFVCPDLEQNKPFIKKVFFDYEIPYFLEDSFNLSSHPLIKAICSYVDLKYKRFDLFSYKKVLRQTSLFADTNLVNSYVEFITKNTYSPSSLLKGIEETTEESKKFKIFRDFTFSLPNILSKDKACSFVAKIKELIEKTNAEKNLSIISEKLKAEGELEQSQFILNGYNYITSILDEITSVLNEEEISAREFKGLLLSCANYTTLSVIPQRSDRVYVGDLNNCKYRFCKHLFVSGLNSSVPQSMADTSILSDSDLRRLDKIKLVIEPKLNIVNARTRENIGVCLSNFAESLTLTYASNVKGKEILPSEILQELKEIFSNKNNPLVIRNKLLEENYILSSNSSNEEKIDLEAKKYLSSNVALKNFAIDLSNYKYKNYDEGSFSSLYFATENFPLLRSVLDEVISSTNSELNFKILGSGELFFPDKKVSASTLESYYSCPYANFIKNGLKITEEDLGQFTAFNLGSFLHSVYEEFQKLLQSGSVVDENNLDEIVNQLIEALLQLDDYKKFLKNPEYDNLFSILRKEVKHVCKEFLLDSKKTSFLPKYFEYAFGYNDTVKGVELKTKYGKYEVRGKIDRVDFADDLVRIIDYKTGSTNDFEKESNLFTGNKLQLYLYLNIFLDQNYTPAGVYYAPINHEYLADTKPKGKSLKGKTIEEEDVLFKTDKDYKSGSTIIDANVDSKGKLNLKNTISRENLISLCKYARIISAKAIEQIKEDNAVISPMKDSCQYCSFNGLCGFHKEKFNATRNEVDILQEQIQTIVEGENE